MLDIVKEDNLIQNTFQICLKKEGGNNTKSHLESYENELKENNDELYFKVDNLYFILIHKIASLHKQKKNCLSYLCSCSVRLQDKHFFKSLNIEYKSIENITNEILDQIINSTIIYLENLDVYPNAKISYKERINVFYEFLKGSCTSRFLKKLLSAIEENDKSENENNKQLNKFFNPIIDIILENLNSRNLIYPKNDVAVLLKFISSFKQLADLVVNNKSIFLYLNLKDRVKDTILYQSHFKIEDSQKDEEEKMDNEKEVNNINVSDQVDGNESNKIYGFNKNGKSSNDKEIGGCGYNLQLNSLLGRLISPTIITMPNIKNKEEIAMYKYFYNNTTNSLNKMTLASLKNIYTVLRGDTNWILENCVEIIKNLLKGSNESKKRVLLWLNCILISNEKKTKIMYHYSTYPQSLDNSYGLFLKLLGENSYGFCLNILWILLCLCEPITINKINDLDLYFFLRDDPFSGFILKNITNQSSFEEISNVEKIKNKVKNFESFKKEPKFITCIFWMAYKALSVFLKPSIDEFIRIVHGVSNAKDKNIYYMNIHTWKIFLYNSRFAQLLFKFLNLCMSYILNVVYLYDRDGNLDASMKSYLDEHKGKYSHLVLKACPPPNESNNEICKSYSHRNTGTNIEPNTTEEDASNNDRSGNTRNADELERENGATNSENNLCASPQFSIIPTFFLSDIFEIIFLLYELDTFKTQHHETFMSYINLDLFLALTIFTMLSEKHIKSIHLRCESAPKTFTYLYKSDSLKSIIEESDLTKKYIIKSLTNVFISSQKGEYTERMQTRLRIVENFNSFFFNKIYVNQFTQLIINNNNLFVHLIHLLLNDVNFLVEEVVSYLSEIKRRENKKKTKETSRTGSSTIRVERSGNGNSQNEEGIYNQSNNIDRRNRNLIDGEDVEEDDVLNEFDEARDHYGNGLNMNYENGEYNEESENNGSGGGSDIHNESMSNLATKTKMIITYCYESCVFLNLLCKNYPINIVTSNTILTQIVTCLNCYFDYLVGHKSLNIKVKNMEQYNFRPQLWLTSIVESYLYLLNLEKNYQDLLIKEIANEGRYYKQEIFNKAYYICKRESLLNKEDLNKFKLFCQNIIDMKDEVELFDDTSDIPEKFLDPILQDIMFDPVLLPTSGIVIDRKNIERHLMSEPNDPFNRAPLSKEQLIPMSELKEEIQNYVNKLKEEKMKKKKKKNVDLDADMDPNEGAEKKEETDSNINKNEFD
ncbi:ubiquitin conjugation factor E4 B, putative [Plasmodium berghei]|uniref:RING-type E3 ubiquitin transferase n=2 Tax=Plasmodium berghei TaxID=5821 RepID=A0A509AMI6_PLABA|nr:ubiquitin conjugation factor E4 B, putative [Plasmodium berghei ANKA]CXI23252.1 ubiquitin conjugation factor E4 B, putative [Plasmodium berghei]SCM20180.1 ubiquitin conjugation factor E4 B, putative [Plasmodium berghei]SCN23807.1 ubiquitin conjugation factor E4 B, putative [Plasmodium berghei]SCO59249.1 ubiquitin conjugation factor E4 B, putative [Plasmodium berghei]SCO60193.1 ubiquitin conjugation factor E4 B, putative [Plasmodium berghei]|eukprot:XP_034420787.1 ubiquitin conjugation factor E4 B, putative [Plasmodium berghei ANKA]